MATLALAINAITFDARPLGEQPTSTRPAAISGGRPNEFARAKPTNGMMVNWQASPTRTPTGILTTRVKSPRLNVVPIANMMICNTGNEHDAHVACRRDHGHEVGNAMNQVAECHSDGDAGDDPDREGKLLQRSLDGRIEAASERLKRQPAGDRRRRSMLSLPKCECNHEGRRRRTPVNPRKTPVRRQIRGVELSSIEHPIDSANAVRRED